MNPANGTTGVLDEAAEHLVVAAQLLDAQDSGEQVFSPTRVVAAQLLLIACGAGPSTVLSPGYVVPGGTVLDHVDLALILISSVAWDDAPPDLLVWSQRLQELRPRILTATAPAS